MENKKKNQETIVVGGEGREEKDTLSSDESLGVDDTTTSDDELSTSKDESSIDTEDEDPLDLIAKEKKELCSLLQVMNELKGARIRRMDFVTADLRIRTQHQVILLIFHTFLTTILYVAACLSVIWFFQTRVVNTLSTPLRVADAIISLLVSLVTLLTCLSLRLWDNNVFCQTLTNFLRMGWWAFCLVLNCPSLIVVVVEIVYLARSVVGEKSTIFELDMHYAVMVEKLLIFAAVCLSQVLEKYCCWLLQEMCVLVWFPCLLHLRNKKISDKVSYLELKKLEIKKEMLEKNNFLWGCIFKMTLEQLRRESYLEYINHMNRKLIWKYGESDESDEDDLEDV